MKMWQFMKWLFGWRRVETFLYTGSMETGDKQIGKPVEINGRKGRVIAGTGLTITVQWEN